MFKRNHVTSKDIDRSFKEGLKSFFEIFVEITKLAVESQRAVIITLVNNIELSEKVRKKRQGVLSELIEPIKHAISDLKGLSGKDAVLANNLLNILLNLQTYVISLERYCRTGNFPANFDKHKVYLIAKKNAKSAVSRIEAAFKKEVDEEVHNIIMHDVEKILQPIKRLLKSHEEELAKRAKG